jgi:DNA-binding response OmpR family regulator
MEKLYWEDIPQKTIFDASEENYIFYANPEDCVVWYKNKKICLSASEMKVLMCLCSAKGDNVSREQINGLFDADRGNIGDVYICHLRKKLEEPFSCKLIHTVRGKGYRISAELKKI